MNFELVTPEELLCSMEDITHVACPGTEGHFGVLTGHMPLISTLQSNAKLVVTDSKGTKTEFSIDGGFVEITQNSVTVLAERAEAV